MQEQRVALQRLIRDSLRLDIVAKRRMCRIVFRRITLVLRLITSRHTVPRMPTRKELLRWTNDKNKSVGAERKSGRRRERGGFSSLFYPLMCNCTRSGAVTHVGQEEE